MKEIKEKVRKFISRYLRAYDLKDDEDIFATGFVNSLFAVQLVLFIENEFSVNVDNSELDVSNFSTLNAIANYINGKSKTE